jgi:hypothetical protein
MPASAEAKRIEKAFEAILQKSLNEPGVAHAMEIYEAIERAYPESAPVNDPVFVASSTSQAATRRG